MCKCNRAPEPSRWIYPRATMDGHIFYEIHEKTWALKGIFDSDKGQYWVDTTKIVATFYSKQLAEEYIASIS